MSSLGMSQYATVLFVNVPKNYPIGADIEVKYTVTPQLEPSNTDWLGIFKIGWCSASTDAVHRVWVQIPEKYEPGQPVNCEAVFEGAMLPKDPEEFYQFCYINSKGQVRGASTPFQFSGFNAGEEDFVEEDIEDMLVVTSKSAILDEKLDLANEKIKVLVEEKLELVKDRQNLMLELSNIKKKQEEYRLRAEHLATNLEAQRLLAEEARGNLVSTNAEFAKLTNEKEGLARQNAELTRREQEMKARMAQLKAAHDESLLDKTETVQAVEARYSAQLHDTREQLGGLQHAYDQLLVQFNKVNDDLQAERRRFADIERVLAFRQAESEKLREAELCMRSELDAALAANRYSQNEAAELRAQLEKLQGEDQRLRQALVASEEKIKELIGHNAALVEETGQEQEEAKQMSSALGAELASVKAKLADLEDQLRLSQACRGGGGDAAGGSLDSYHALLTAYDELKTMLKEHTREKNALARNEKSIRAHNSKLMVENQSLTAELATSKDECCGLRKENQLLREAADKQNAGCAGSCLDDSWVCTSAPLLPQGSAATAGASMVDAGRSNITAAIPEERERHATIVRQLREQLLASDDYYMATLQLAHRDLQHEREARQELQRLLHKAARRIACGGEDKLLGEACTRAAAAAAASDIGESTSVAPLVQPAGAATAPSLASSSSSSSGPRERLSSSDDDNSCIREPPDDPFLGTTARYVSGSVAGRSLGPRLPPTDLGRADAAALSPPAAAASPVFASVQQPAAVPPARPPVSPSSGSQCSVLRSGETPATGFPTHCPNAGVGVSVTARGTSIPKPGGPCTGLPPAAAAAVAAEWLQQ